MDAWFARIESECVVIDSPVPDCQHKSIVAVPGGSDCEDCPKTWRPDPEAEWIDEPEGMSEFFHDSDDMYGSFKY